MLDDYAINLAVNLMELDFYRTKRYKVPMTVALIQSECSDLFETFIDNHMRLTDLYQYLDNNTFCIIFGHTDKKGSEIALNKLIKDAKSSCPNPIYAGFTEVLKTDKNSDETIFRASTGLKLARKPQSKNVVLI